ncbi:hypothetical protein YPPY47_1948, partial [Yersinia pestis PY-47]
MSVGN